MRLQIQNPKSKIRNAFTLVEMLVVLTLVVVITTLVVVATLRMSDKDTVPSGARAMQGNLALARTRALAERRAVGIRLLIAAQNPPGVPVGLTGMAVADQMQFIHDPGDFADGYGQTSNFHPVTGSPLLPTDRLFNRIIAGPTPATVPYAGFTFTNPGGPTLRAGPILPNDRVQFHGQGQPFLVHPEDARLSLLFLNRAADALDGMLTPPSPAITQTIYAPGETFNGRTMIILGRGPNVDQRMDYPIQVPNVVTPSVNYRIMRRPRPIPGEAPVALPRNVFVIAADENSVVADRIESSPRFGVPPDTYGEILFDASGRVVGSAAESIFLWVSDVQSTQRPPVDTNWSIIGIQTRTGSISTYPVDLSSPPTSYYNFARIGRASGM